MIKLRSVAFLERPIVGRTPDNSVLTDVTLAAVTVAATAPVHPSDCSVNRWTVRAEGIVAVGLIVVVEQTVVADVIAAANDNVLKPVHAHPLTTTLLWWQPQSLSTAVAGQQPTSVDDFIASTSALEMANATRRRLFRRTTCRITC